MWGIPAHGQPVGWGGRAEDQALRQIQGEGKKGETEMRSPTRAIIG